MLTLGDLLRQADAAAPTFVRWLETAEPGLAARVANAAGEHGPGRFARETVAAFDRHADAGAWARLTSRLHNAEDPALICLEEMVRWRLGLNAIGAKP